MLDSKIVDDLVKRLADAMPEGLRDAKKDMEKNFRSIIQGAFAKLDLVTREEFDVQKKVLARTREKLDELAQKIQAIKPGSDIDA